MSFHFVLTRKISSDPIESFFGWLRKSAGSNDQTDVRAVLTGIEKTLKTGIASASSTSNIMAAEESDCLSTRPQQKNTREQCSEEFPADARKELIERLNRDKPLLPTPDVATLAMVGGYLARAVRENFECVECFALLTKPNASTPSDSLIKHQDREGFPILARESHSMRLNFLVEPGQPVSECSIPALALPPPLETRLGFPEVQEMGFHRVCRAVLWEGASHGADVALELVGPSSYV
ncbi:hypothetical protein HPB49_025091 [Dermacentor silvarum]|uniref:Uncharacterized protein n=1 Tax=Dermacentor silvarum TaxID=543639 RepID=A0ACB8CCF7_DERSI|nr:hypothetical protein HPB49_025091 [Dermacentor silvarum]